MLDTAELPPLLADGTLRGVGLDVTDPEPLPDDSPLWRHPACLVTAHTANPAPAWIAAFAGLVTENVRRRVAGGAAARGSWMSRRATDLVSVDCLCQVSDAGRKMSRLANLFPPGAREGIR